MHSGRGEITPQSHTEKDISCCRDFSLGDTLRQPDKSKLLGNTIKLLQRQTAQSLAGKTSPQCWEKGKATSEQRDIWQAVRLQTIDDQGTVLNFKTS